MVKLSVIVPMLRRDEAAERCLAEIRRQAAEGGAELDLVIVEGVSPLGRAYNEGLLRAKGDYVAWVDADDIVLEGWWSAIVNALADGPDIVVLGWHDDQSASDFSCRISIRNAAEELLRTVLRDRPPCSFLWNKVIRRGVWGTSLFDENFRFLTDFVLLPHIISKVKTVRTINQPLYRYSYNPKGVSRGSAEDAQTEIMAACWRRVEEWRGTTFASDALCPALNHLAICYERAVRDLSEGTARAFFEKQRQIVRGVCILDILRSSVSRRVKAKVLCGRLGWYWPQRIKDAIR